MALQDRESRGDGFDHLIPVWDNDPSTLRKFRRNTELWLAGLDLERTTGYSLAARFLLRQHGPARARGEEFAIEDLAYDPGESREGVDGEQHWVREPDYKKGVRKLLDAFEELSGKTRSEKKHELRSKLYGGLKRKPGESVTQFAASYRTLQGELRTEGIVVQDTEYAWIFQQRLGLSEIQRQLLETTVGEEPSYNAVEKEALRLFRRIHLKGMDDAPVRSLRTSSFSSGSTSTTPSTRRKPFHGSLRSRATPPRSEAQVAELSAPEPEEDEAQLEETQVYEGQVEESTLDLDEAQEKELEALATSLDEMEGELDDQGLNEAEAALSDMAEALMTLKEARGKIAAVKKDRGYGKPVDGGVRSSSSTSVAARKRDTKCNACGLKGHWAGDPECKSKAKPKKKVGHKNVNFAEAGDMNEAQVIDFLQGGQLDTDGFHEILAVDLADVLDVKKVETSWQKPYFAAVDSCCNRTCAGESWVEAIRKALPREFKGLWKESPESERFRFGDGGCLTSSRRVRVPMNFEGQVVLVWFSVLPNNRLAGLLGKDFLDAMGGILDFPRQTITLETLGLVNHPLQTIRAGHFAVEVNPAACVWKPAPRELTARLFRSLGKQGVVEVFLSRKAWLNRKLGARAKKPTSGTREVCVSEACGELPLLRPDDPHICSPTEASVRDPRTPSTTCSYRRTSSSAYKQSSRGLADVLAQGHLSQDVGSRVRAKSQPRNRTMAAPCGAPPKTRFMALLGLIALAHQSTIPAFPSISCAIRGLREQVGGAGCGDGGSWSIPAPLPHQMQDEQKLYGVQLEGPGRSSEQGWVRAGIPGGRSPDSGDASSEAQARSPSPTGRGSNGGSSQGLGERGQGRKGSPIAGSTRRITSTAWRVDSVGGASSRGDQGRRFGGRDRKEGQTNSPDDGWEVCACECEWQPDGGALARGSGRAVGRSPSFDALSVASKDKAIPPSGPGRLAARVSPGSGRMGILYGAVKAGVRQMIGQAAGKALKMLKVAAPPLVYEALETVVENEYDKGLSEPRCPGG